MNTEEVIAYLNAHPEVAEHILTEVQLPDPHDGRAISIGERQIIALRDKVRLLEVKLSQLVHFGEENDAITDKLHRLTLAMMMARSLPGLFNAVHFNLREDFAVPHTAMRVWGLKGHDSLAECSAAEAAVTEYASGLTHPICGADAPECVRSLFGDSAAHLRSFALIPLRAEQMGGILALASEDAERFYAEMGTLYLQRMGEQLSIAITRVA